jgi:hypothetical protein
MKPLHTDGVWFESVFRRFSASFTSIIGRVVGFGGVGRVDSTGAQQMITSHE